MTSDERSKNDIIKYQLQNIIGKRKLIYITENDRRKMIRKRIQKQMVKREIKNSKRKSTNR